MNGIALAPLTDGMPADGGPWSTRASSWPPTAASSPRGPRPTCSGTPPRAAGSVTAAGKRGDDELSQNDVTVMLDAGKLLKAGGNVNYDRTDASFVPASRNSYLIDINAARRW
jgi:hypothetical protein